MDDIVNLEDRYALEIQISEFGQVPKQIFTTPHPGRVLGLPMEMIQSQKAKNESTEEDEEFEDIYDKDRRVVKASSFTDGELNAVKYWKNIDQLRRVCDYQVLSAVVISSFISLCTYKLTVL